MRAMNVVMPLFYPSIHAGSDAGVLLISVNLLLPAVPSRVFACPGQGQNRGPPDRQHGH